MCVWALQVGGRHADCVSLTLLYLEHTPLQEDLGRRKRTLWTSTEENLPLRGVIRPAGVDVPWHFTYWFCSIHRAEAFPRPSSLLAGYTSAGLTAIAPSQSLLSRPSNNSTGQSRRIFPCVTMKSMCRLYTYLSFSVSYDVFSQQLSLYGGRKTLASPYQQCISSLTTNIDGVATSIPSVFNASTMTALSW